MAGKKFATAINCIDGRTQIPVINWVKEKFQVDYVDEVTHPGADKDVTFAKEAVLVSVEKHGSKAVVIAGHADCAGFPVTKEEHVARIVSDIKIVESWNLPEVYVVGLWVDIDGKVEKVS